MICNEQKIADIQRLKRLPAFVKRYMYFEVRLLLEEMALKGLEINSRNIPKEIINNIRDRYLGRMAE